MDEFRCETTVQFEIDQRGVLWKICRSCSRLRGTAMVKRKVYHRWNIKRLPPERLKDYVRTIRV